MFAFLNKFRKPKTREISLKELSVYWMDKPEHPVAGTTDMTEPAPGQESKAHWEHTEINNFYTSYIMPHTHTTIEPASVSAMEEILTILDGPDGDCPSIVPEDEETPAQYHALTSTLREHSLDVTREAYDILKKSDGLLLAGKILIATLGHDLGKILNKDGEGEPINLHAYKSAKMLESITKDLQYRENILAAVKCHHRPKSELERMKNDTVFILRQADWEARRKELDHLAIFHKPASQEKDLDHDKAKVSFKPGTVSQSTFENLVQTIEPFININDIDSAFSFKNTVYIHPSWLTKTILLIKGKDFDSQKIADLMAEKSKVPVLEYRIHFMNSKKKPENIQYYALKSDLFGNFDEIDKRRKRNNLLRTIKSIE